MQESMVLETNSLQRDQAVSRAYALPRPTDTCLWGIIGYLAQNAANHALRMRDALAEDRAKFVTETTPYVGVPVPAFR